MAKKFYAVVKGAEPGIYNAWEGGAKEQVHGYPAARFRGFATEEEARSWYCSQVDPDYQEPWEQAGLDGYAIMVMLQPHNKNQDHVQMLGTNLYDEPTEDLARQAALDEFWTPEHDLMGTPIVEVHLRPEKALEAVKTNHRSKDYAPEPGDGY